MFNKIEIAASFIKSKIEGSPEIGLILGSGLGVLADEIENPITIPYHEIPEFRYRLWRDTLDSLSLDI